MGIRPARADDEPVLVAALLWAVNWDASRPALSVEQAMADPRIAHYVDGWPGARDRGVVAEDTDAYGAAIGAAWWRFFAADDPGFGWIDAAVPEVSIGVAPAWRGRGVGTAQLKSLHQMARDEGIATLSLSVEKANGAVALYRRLGYEVVADDGNAFTMAADLRSFGATV